MVDYGPKAQFNSNLLDDPVSSLNDEFKSNKTQIIICSSLIQIHNHQYKIKVNLLINNEINIKSSKKKKIVARHKRRRIIKFVNNFFNV